MTDFNGSGAAGEERPWKPGEVPVAVVMISLNEGHNLDAVLDNLAGWAREVFLVDSYSTDQTVDIALRRGVHVVQRRFEGFGDQWNFALDSLPITSLWTMKLDPDERLSDGLKASIADGLARGEATGFEVCRRLWFMERRLPITQWIPRVWRTGRCRFTDVLVNEHPLIDGTVERLSGELEHHDSPDLHHWLDKQNRYSTAEAVTAYKDLGLAAAPRLLGSGLQRRMWLKKNLRRIPFRFGLLFLYHWLILGAWRAGWVGYAWARLRADVYRLREYKYREMKLTGRTPVSPPRAHGAPDARVRQY